MAPVVNSCQIQVDAFGGLGEGRELASQPMRCEQVAGTWRDLRDLRVDEVQESPSSLGFFQSVDLIDDSVEGKAG